MAAYLGDFPEDATVHFMWDSFDSSGGSITRATDGTISVYKDNGLTQTTAGITDTEDFDSLTGVHVLTIDTSADAFYATGSNYTAVLSGATIDGQTVNAVLCHFSIENRFAEVNVTAMANDVITAAVIANSAIDANTFAAGAINAAAIASDAITNAKIAADAIGASEIAADAIGASELASDAINEIWAKVCETEGSYTAQQIMSIALSVLAGETNTGGSVFRTPNDAATRVSATTDASNNRTVMVLTPSS